MSKLLTILAIMLLLVGSKQAFANTLAYKQSKAKPPVVRIDNCPLKSLLNPSWGTACDTNEPAQQAQSKETPYADSEVARLISQPILKDLK
jgi:hypothetical protein